jgi:hypothetical protein
VLVVAEHRRNQNLEEQYGCMKRTRLLKQGDAALSFYEAEVELPDPATAGLA